MSPAPTPILAPVLTVTDKVGVPGEQVAFEAVLKRPNGTPIPGAAISFQIKPEGKPAVGTWSGAETDANGKAAKLLHLPSIPQQPYQLIAHYDGKPGELAGANATGQLKMFKGSVEIYLKLDATNGPTPGYRWFNVLMKRSNDGDPINDLLVVNVNGQNPSGQKTVTGQPLSLGSASQPLKAKVEVSYPGSDTFIAASKTFTFP